ncbi:Ferredoxin--NADP reductase root isozyme [Tripterygium wilfordii]|uniref:Ferredoxin--NADP reductase root isozyme n=1 Tax=Tripterygium wilfordii TaxID=458696 RepID=A0A7J7CQQ2_TRIWF|nr:Ferredoxin--NADP reductase root isozyme [Tripterygium wilfordii]
MACSLHTCKAKSSWRDLHIVIDHGGNVPYWEGQSYGVIPPGENLKKPGAPDNRRMRTETFSKANTDSRLYDDELTQYLKDYPDHFRYDRALNREEKNKSEGKIYVQDKIEEYSDEIFRLLDNGAHIYIFLARFSFYVGGVWEVCA